MPSGLGAISEFRKTITILDNITALGYRYATAAGISIAACDMRIPEQKYEIVRGANAEVDAVDGQYKDGLITSGEM